MLIRSSNIGLTCGRSFTLVTRLHSPVNFGHGHRSDYYSGVFSKFHHYSAKRSMNNAGFIVWCGGNKTVFSSSQKQILPIASKFSTCRVLHEVAPPERFPGYKPVYRFPHIVFVRALCRLKIYQTLLNLVVAPGAIFTCSLGLIPPASAGMLIGVCSGATAMVFLSGEIFRRIVGFIYLNEEKNGVIISHLSWWGYRIDVEVSLSDIVPLAEASESGQDSFFWLTFFSSKQRFLVFTRFGGIQDQIDFEKIFGK